VQIFPCPFCGERNEREFHFAGEAGKTRPDTTTEISDVAWAAYLYNQKNIKGAVREVWMHLSCAELFILERDSITMDVVGSISFREEA